MSNIKIGIIGGSGIDDPGILKNPEKINMETPYGATSTPLTIGKIDEVDVAIIARHGKGHVITPTKVPFRANIWALKKIGCTHIIGTTACGSLQENYKPRELVFLDQFIDFTKQRNLTFFEDFKDKIVHTPMAEPFCPKLNGILADIAESLNIAHHKQGTTITIEGPRFSTKAESRFFRSTGADVINMSTIPEAILARELGICYSCVAMVTDYDVWHETEDSVTWDMIVNVMKDNAENVKRLLLDAIPKINFNNCENCRNK
jgi:5'-methylthioadenosine phosphorylase